MSDKTILDTQDVKTIDHEPNVVGVPCMSKLVCITLIIIENQEDQGGVTIVDALVTDMQKDDCSMDINGGDESDTQIVSYKRRKTTQPITWLSARKRLTTLVPCTQEAYLVDSGEPIRFLELSQVNEGVIQEPKVDLASTKGKRPNAKARST